MPQSKSKRAQYMRQRRAQAKQAGGTTSPPDELASPVYMNPDLPNDDLPHFSETDSLGKLPGAGAAPQEKEPGPELEKDETGGHQLDQDGGLLKDQGSFGDSARHSPKQKSPERHYGPNTPDPWGDAEPLEKPESVPQEVLDLVAETRKKLDTRGWDLWKVYGDDFMVIVRDQGVTGYPPNLPVYTEAELRTIAGVDSKTRRMIHESKKWGATVLPGMGGVR